MKLPDGVTREEFLIALDREFVRQKGLREFIKRAWHQVVPQDQLLWNWHIDAMSEYLEAISNGELRNLLICVPPGCMKSLTVSTFWPAWDWIANPGRRYIVATFAADLSNKNAKLQKDLVMGDWYAERWGDIVEVTGETTSQIKNFENKAGGSRVSTATGAGIIGRHANVLIFDDLVKTQDADGPAALDPKAIHKANDFWFKAMATRQANPKTTAKVGIAQRLHHEDTPGLCIDSGDYETLVLPMRYDPHHPQVWARDPRKEGELLWPERFSEEEVSTLEYQLGSTAAAAQLQQEPTPAGGAMFKEHDLEHTYHELASGARLIIVADCTFKSQAGADRVAIQVWAKEFTPRGYQFKKVDNVTKRMGLVDTIAAIEKVQRQYPKACEIHIEDKANGSAVIEVLRTKLPGVKAWPPKGTKFPSKIERANAVLPMFENGEVLFPKGVTWMDEYKTEMMRFPLGKHDDQVDATTMALLILRTSHLDAYAQAFGKK